MASKTLDVRGPRSLEKGRADSRSSGKIRIYWARSENVHTRRQGRLFYAGAFSFRGQDQGMNPDWRVCSRARLSRDPRFDGKFFIGVKGSGVYCRSICPAPNAREKNCTYFPTAAAAAEAGFRPCLRCRPESSPGTPAWLGTSNTVSRALRLIDSGEFLNHLCELPGIGEWTAQCVAMRALGEPDAFPSTDLGLLRAMNLRNPHELEGRAEAWRPWRSYAAMYLWRLGPQQTTVRKTKPFVETRSGKNGEASSHGYFPLA
jgi:hypothetical protein